MYLYEDECTCVELRMSGVVNVLVRGRMYLCGTEDVRSCVPASVMIGCCV